MPGDSVVQPFRGSVDVRVDYPAELNAQQLAAVTAVPGPALVIAGAGSGKTRTLTYRVAFLIEQGIPADRILLLTFTNKAAREMMRRVAELLGAELPELWGGTFHSIGARLLRRHAASLGFRSDFTILDRDDASDLIKLCLGEAGIDPKAGGSLKAEVLADLFSMAANKRCPVADLVKEEDEHFAVLGPQIQDLAARYAARKLAANVMDFDDLLVLWLRLLQEDTELCERYQHRFQFILVDEYQDTNQLQSDLIDLLAERHRNVMVVGDDSQSIYAWRGANFRNIFEFPKRYPGAQVYKIETNYRSSPEILSVANAAIAPNVDQFRKELAAVRRSGAKPIVVACYNGRHQAAFVGQRVTQLREEGVSLNRMAVLYRSHFHSLELQLELTRARIPFQITSGIRFFEQAHIKDVAAYLKLIANPTDEMAFRRLALMLPGIGNKAAQKLWAAFRAQSPAGPGRLAEMLQRCAAVVPKKVLTAWTEFVIIISQLEVEPTRSTPAAMLELILEAGYELYLQETFPNYRARLEDLQQLATFARQTRSLEAFLTELSLLTNVEAEDHEPARADSERLRLTTIHQAKGLEFDVVFVIMLCDGAFPSARSLETLAGEEEERRLFYVAITRARDELYLSYPILRSGPGQSGQGHQRPSRFLAQIPCDLIQEVNLPTYAPYA